MSSRRRFFLQSLALGLSTWYSIPWAWAMRRLKAVRMWPAEEYTRVTLESEQSLIFKSFFIQDPPRFVLDLEEVSLDSTLQSLSQYLSKQDPNVRAIRIAQYTPHTVRLVFDLYHAIAPQIFALQPIEPYQHRLVLDLHPQHPPDPLELLIKQNTPSSPSTQASSPLISNNRKPLELLIQPPLDLPDSLRIPRSPARPSLPPQSSRVIIIAIDPGHGGEDPGAIGPEGTKEKDIVLSIALLLKERLHQAKTRSGHSIQVLMTRDGDYFVPLHQRVQKARRVKADLLMSIHADAFMSPRPKGASVFALSTKGASSAAARWMANKENLSDLIGGTTRQSLDQQLQNTLADMMTTSQIRDSLELGGIILSNLKQIGHLHKPQVEQAGFAVLKAPDIPSILVETAFISNPEEEQRLRSDLFQNSMAETLAQGILDYFERFPPSPRERSLS